MAPGYVGLVELEGKIKVEHDFKDRIAQGDAARAQGDWELAEKRFQAAARIKDVASVRSRLQEVDAQVRELAVKRLTASAEAALGAGSLELARQKLEEARVLSPNDPRVEELLRTMFLPHPSWASKAKDEFGVRAEVVVKGMVFHFRHIPAGKFLMGSPESEQGHFSDEGPQQVAISKEFWMLETEVTQAQWEAVMGGNPSYFKGPNLPVENVSWQDCTDFAVKLNGLVPGLNSGLPTEAQWEYACRAGKSSAYNDGSACTQLTGVDPALEKLGWYDKNSGGKTHEVGQKQPNAWGLYDHHGNVWEWCRDGRRTYGEEAVIDPVGPEDNEADRMLRGGSYGFNAWNCRSACRLRRSPGLRLNFFGFRLAAGL